MYYAYVIKNDKNKIYIGQTDNLEKRIKRHNGILSTKKSSYTFKNKGEWNYLYVERFKSRREAIIREKQLKSCQGRLFIKNKYNLK